MTLATIHYRKGCHLLFMKKGGSAYLVYNGKEYKMPSDLSYDYLRNALVFGDLIVFARCKEGRIFFDVMKKQENGLVLIESDVKIDDLDVIVEMFEK